MLSHERMIAAQCFTNEWQARQREALGGCDPVLLEKTIRVCALLDALAARGLEFVFKGGTSLLLHLPQNHRPSIDADILCQGSAKKLDQLLTELSRTHPFTGMTEDERRRYAFQSGGIATLAARRVLVRASTGAVSRPWPAVVRGVWAVRGGCRPRKSPACARR